MFGNGELARLKLRKAELLAESDALRQSLVSDWVKLKPIAAWIEAGTDIFRRIQPLLMTLAPFLGFWVARRRRVSFGFARILTVGWRVWRAITTMRRTSQTG